MSQLCHETCGALLGIELLRLFQAVDTILLAVHQRELKQMCLVAPLRHEELCRGNLPVERPGYDNLLRHRPEPAPYLWDGIDKNLLLCLLKMTLVLECERLVYLSVLDVHIVDVGIAVRLVGEACEDVDIGYCMADDLALGTELLDKLILLLKRLGVLETHLPGGLLHLVPDMSQEASCVAFEYLPRGGDISQIILPRLPPYAASSAVLDMVFEAGFVAAAADALRRYHHAAGAWVVDALYEVEDGIHRPDMRERAEVLACLPVYLACLENAWERLVRNHYRGVCLPVLQQDIIAGVVFLYQGVLEEQRVVLCVHHGIRDIHNLRDEDFRLEPVHLLMEIRGDAALQVLRLAYIYYDAVSIEILVAARFLRHVCHDILQSGESCLVFFFCHITLVFFLFFSFFPPLLSFLSCRYIITQTEQRRRVI